MITDAPVPPGIRFFGTQDRERTLRIRPQRRTLHVSDADVALTRVFDPSRLTPGIRVCGNQVGPAAD